MKKVLILCLALIFLSCNHEVENTISTKNLRQFHVKGINASFFLPKEFQELDLKVYKDLLIKNKVDKIAKKALEGIMLLEKSGAKCQMFVNMLDLEETILFFSFSKEFIPLDKYVGSYYMNILENSFHKRWGDEVDLERLEKKFLTTRKKKMVKLKYLVSIFGKEGYQTQYLVSEKPKTFGVLVNSRKGNDYKDFVKSVILK